MGEATTKSLNRKGREGRKGAQEKTKQDFPLCYFVSFVVYEICAGKREIRAWQYGATEKTKKNGFCSVR